VIKHHASILVFNIVMTKSHHLQLVITIDCNQLSTVKSHADPGGLSFRQVKAK